MEKIGLIVGNGKLPLYFIEETKNSNISVYPIGLFPSVDEEIKKSDNYAEFNVGHIGEIIKYLLLNDITKIVMLGNSPFCNYWIYKIKWNKSFTSKLFNEKTYF